MRRTKQTGEKRGKAGKAPAPRAEPAGSDGAFLSADKLTELTGLTDRRHRQLAQEGWFPQKTKEGWQKDPTTAGIIRYLTEQLHTKSDALKQEQEQLARARREKVEEETKILREQYVEKAQIAPALRNVSLHQRAVLQFKLEQEVAPKLAGMKGPEILAEMRGAVDAICSVFAEGIRPWLDSPP